MTRHDGRMTTEISSAQLGNNTAQHRYELHLGDRLCAHIAYRPHGEGVIDMVHTEVEPDLEGQGLASKIAKFALDDARSRHLKVMASCRYLAAYIAKHAEYGDLVAA